jgi:predicted dehydrogenase
MSKIRLGVLGGGGDSLIGVLHRVASSMYGRYEIVGGVFNPVYEENIKFAEQIGVNADRIYEDFDTLIAEEIKKPKEERIEVVSVLTPNFLHFPMAKKLLENGFHVICEKPLTTSYDDAKELEALQKKTQSYFRGNLYLHRISIGPSYEAYDRSRGVRKNSKNRHSILSRLD